MLGESLIKCGPIGLNNFGGLDGWLYFHFSIDKISPLQFGGGAGTPDSVEGPNVRHPVSTLLNQSLLSRVGSYLLQNQEPSTAKISDKENSCFLQNQEPHMCKHQNKSKNITC